MSSRRRGRSSGYRSDLSQAENGLIIGLSVGAFVLIVVIIFVCDCIVRRCQQGGGNENPNVNENPQPMDGVGGAYPNQQYPIQGQQPLYPAQPMYAPEYSPQPSIGSYPGSPQGQGQGSSLRPPADLSTYPNPTQPDVNVIA